MNIKNLNSFLKLGYFLDYDSNRSYINVSQINKDKYKDATERELVKIGSDLWRQSITHNFKSNQKHLVPISGGLDSRAILAGLLEHTEANNIYTYTFGSPKTLDYEIGNYIAKVLGTNHTSFSLTDYNYKQDELNDISSRVDYQTMLFHHAPVFEVDRQFQDCANWSGFMGDPIAGSKLLRNPSQTLTDAKKAFIKKNTYVRSVNLSSNDDFDDLIVCDAINNDKLTIDEQLDFQNRQLKYIAPHVLMKGFNYKLPFLYQPWVDFMLSIPNEFRTEQRLYKQVLSHTFPKEFGYKTKTNSGHSLNTPKWIVLLSKINNKILSTLKLKQNININYLDFNKEIRKNFSLQNIIKSNISDLKDKKIIDWIDVDKILNNHLSNKGDFSDALIILTSLEIHLKNGKKL